MVSSPKISIVVTVYNDEKIVPVLVKEITRYLLPLNITYEIILVDDSSVDNSENVIRIAAENNTNVKGISLSRNFGQQIAMSAGIRNASGEYVLIMDGDLQNPPSLIPVLYNKIREGFDIIYCTSKVRNDFVSKITSRIFWFIIYDMFKVNIVKDQLMMKIMSRGFVDKYNSYNEIHRTVSGIVKDIGLKYDIIEVQNQKRHSGKSNYNFFKRFNLMIDIIISLSISPLNLMIYFGFIIFIITCIAIIYYLIRFLTYDIIPGFTSIMLTLFFFGGITVFMLGFIGRYLANIYSEVRQRPLYIIKNKYNL